MKWICAVFVVGLVGVYAEDYCYTDSNHFCGDLTNDVPNCSANFSGFSENVQFLQSYANHQLAKSFDYLLLSTNFANYVKNRPGFEKQFRLLSDTAWENAINLIKQITKRGGSHDFSSRISAQNIQQNKMLELGELNAMALALDIEKELAKEAHDIHERYSHAAHKTHYDPEVTFYLEEKFLEKQANTIRKLSGYTNDLKNLMKDTTDKSLSLYLFDDYLQSA